MSKVQTLRVFVNQRLSLAAEEIFDLFERTIAEYEEQLCRSKEENERQRKLLDAVFKPQLRLHRADVQQPLTKEEEQQEWSSSLDQEDPPELPHIKEEQEEFWTNREEADITKVSLAPAPIKSEDDDELTPQCSQLHQRQPEADGEDCGLRETPRNLYPDSRLLSAQTSLNSLKNKVIVSDIGFNTGKKPFNCSECGKIFSGNAALKIHMRIHTGEKPFSCSLCSKRFTQKAGLDYHWRTHTGEKPYSCSLCSKCFSRYTYLQTHMRTHTGEKPFTCPVCNKCFSWYRYLQLHMRAHTGEKPYICRVCDKRFTWSAQLKRHKCVGESSRPLKLWTNQEEEQLQGLEEADITKLTFTPVSVKVEGDDAEKQRQIELIKTIADEEDCAEPEPDLDLINPAAAEAQT